MEIQLKRDVEAPVPTYAIRADGTFVGRVWRSGSLPSCQAWNIELNPLARADFQARTGRDWERIPRHLTRAGALRQFQEQWDG